MAIRPHRTINEGALFMEVRYFKHYSNCLGREMEFKVYGHRGKPVLFIPCQAGRFVDFENFHMDDIWRPWIDQGRVMVFSIDTIDGETFCSGVIAYSLSTYCMRHANGNMGQLAQATAMYGYYAENYFGASSQELI
jgi:esterase/lipase superfamily enzyme